MVNGATEAPSDCAPLINHGNYYTNVIACLGYDSPNPPLADFLRRYYCLEGHWLVASPIHWEATHNDAMIVAAGDLLCLSEQDSRLLFADVTQFLKENNIETFYHDASTWLLRVDNLPLINSQSVYQLLHRSLMPTLNNLDDGMFWQRLITELQMYLNSHSMNNNRLHTFPVNGLWFWGEGQFKWKQKKIITDDELLLQYPNAINIQQLSEPLKTDKDSLLFIKYPDRIDLAALQEKKQKHTVQWYWNNLAYSKQPLSWWSRLWRS